MTEFDNEDSPIAEGAEALISPEDIRSTSRSCLAILVILAFIVVVLCVFVVVQTWIR